MTDESLKPGDGKNRKKPHGAHVRLLARHLNLKLKLGDGPAKIADETSGWTTIDRPRDVAITDWVGAQPLKISIPIILDGYGRGDGVGHKLSRLHKLVRDKDGDQRPRTFVALGPIPFSGHRFVMESIEYGDDVIRGAAGTKEAGKLFRQDLTLHLMQFIPPDRIKFKRRRKHRGGRHHSKEGDTALKIANDLYGDDEDPILAARQIAQLNGIRGIRTPIASGRILAVNIDVDVDPKKNGSP